MSPRSSSGMVAHFDQNNDVQVNKKRATTPIPFRKEQVWAFFIFRTNIRRTGNEKN
jgi:hypothetical protein